MLEKVQKILNKFPSNHSLEQLDDDLMSGRRLCPLDKHPSFKEVREAREELANFIYRMESLEK